MSSLDKSIVKPNGQRTPNFIDSEVHRAVLFGVWLIVLLWCAVVVWFGSDAGVGPFAGILFFVSGCVVAALSLILLLIELPLSKLCGRVIGGLCPPVLVALVALLWMSGTLFRVRVELSSHALENYVRGLPPEIDRKGNDRVGLFTIKRTLKVKSDPRVTYLVTADISGNTAGVAFSKGGEPAGFGNQESDFTYIGRDWWYMVNFW